MDQNNFVIAEEQQNEIALSCTNKRGTIQINLRKVNGAWISTSTLPILNVSVEEISADVFAYPSENFSEKILRKINGEWKFIYFNKGTVSERACNENKEQTVPHIKIERDSEEQVQAVTSESPALKQLLKPAIKPIPKVKSKVEKRTVRPRLRPENFNTETGPQATDRIVERSRPPTAEELQSALNDALNDEPLAHEEVNDLIDAIKKCWFIEHSKKYSKISVTLGVSFDRKGTPLSDSIYLISSSEGNSNDIKMAYRSALRAIFLCAGDGYDLPHDKYNVWKQMEIAFIP